MKRLLLSLVAALGLGLSVPALAVPPVALFTGSGAADNAVLFTTNDLIGYDACMLMSTTGAVDVFASLKADATSFSTAAIKLEDYGATDGADVVVTAPLRMYVLTGKYRFVRVLQNGATAAAADMLCWSRSGQ